MSNTRKKVLFHLPFKLSPIYYGAQSRALGFLRYFAERRDFISLDIVAANQSLKDSWITPQWDAEQTQEALKFADNVFVYEGRNSVVDFLYSRSKIFYYQVLLRQQLPVDTDYYAPLGYVNFIRSLASKSDYDYVWINTINFASLAQPFMPTHTRTVLDIHDLACRQRKMLKDVLNYKNLQFDYEQNFRKEACLLAKFDVIVTNSSYESSLLSSHFSTTLLYDIQHSVDYFSPQSHSDEIPYASRSFEYDLLFIGMANVQNTDGLKFFLDAIFPRILKVRPEIKLAVAGRVCDSVQIAEDLSPNIDLLGYVPDLGSIYLKSRVMLCPLRTGAGSSVKLLEAMSFSMPIVTTNHCAVALSLQNNLNAMIANDEDTFSDYVLRVLADREFACSLSQAVQDTYKRLYSKSAIYEQLDSLFGIRELS